MASFDIVTFTTVSLDETIKIICNELFKDHDTYHNCAKKQFISQFDVAIEDFFFIQ